MRFRLLTYLSRSNPCQMAYIFVYLLRPCTTYLQVLNEEGLPIIEITEPIDLSSKEAPISAPIPIDDLPLNPDPPPPLTAAQKAHMERILDILEAEEAEDKHDEDQFNFHFPNGYT